MQGDEREDACKLLCFIEQKVPQVWPVGLTMAAEEVNRVVQAMLASPPNIELRSTAILFRSALLSSHWRMIVYSAGNFC